MQNDSAILPGNVHTAFTRSVKYLSLAALLAFAACSGNEGVDPDAIRITNVALASGIVGASYNAPLSATGGDGSYTWSIAAGTLPDGLSLAGASITGTPTMPFTSMVTIQVNDGSEMSATRDFTLTVTDLSGPLEIVTADVPNGVLGSSYDAAVAAQGGDRDYSWSLSTGSLPPGLTLASSGSPGSSISGTPTAAGTFMFQVQVMDGASEVDQTMLTIVITETSMPLTVRTSALQSAQIGVSYSTTIVASGGTNAGYSWSLLVGALPPGLILDPAGTPSTLIHGTPSASGSYDFTLSVIDSGGTVAIRPLSIVVEGELAIEPPLLDPATVGETYTATLTAVGGRGTSFTWGLVAGKPLPAGLSLADNGDTALLTGTVTSTGTYGFTVELNSDATETASVSYTLEVVLPPLRIITAVLPDAQEGVAYSATLEATGGSEANYTWSVAAAGLPAGLFLRAAGTPGTIITGSTTELGSYPLTIEVRDSTGLLAQTSLTLEVTPTVGIGPTQIPGRAICNGGVTTLTSPGGTAPFSWTVSAGALPAGWQLEASSSATVNVSGRATTASTANFSIMVTDNLGESATQPFSVTITDDSNPQRWVVAVGDVAVDSVNGVFLFDVCGDTPGAPIEVSPTLPSGDASGTPDHTQFSPDGTAVAFIGDLSTDGLRDLYIYDLSSAAPVALNLTNFALDGAMVSDFHWSPNSAFLVYSAFPSRGERLLHYVDLRNRAAPGTPVVISPGGPGQAGTVSTSWSPNSERLIFNSDFAGTRLDEFYYADVSNPASPLVGVKIHPPLVGGQRCSSPVAWAPDSSGVLFRCDTAVAQQQELWFTKFNPAPSAPIRVNNAGYGVDNDVGNGDFGFNAAGTMAYYLADEANDGSQELWIVPFANGLPGTPFRAGAALPANRTITSAVWDPAGTRLAFRSDLGANEVFDLYVVDVSGGATALPAQVSAMPVFGDLNSENRGPYVWSNNGAQIAYIGDQDIDTVQEAYVADVSGTPPYLGVRFSPPAINLNVNVDEVYWSPNDEWLAVRGEFTFDEEDDLYVTNVAVPAPYLPQQVNLPLPIFGDVIARRGNFAFRSDSLGVFFKSDMILNNKVEIWMADFSTGTVQAPVAINPPLSADQDMFNFYLNK